VKKAIIVVSLVRECRDMSNDAIEKEIRKELSKGFAVIPWAKEIESVTVR